MNPVRKLSYNLVITGFSVVVALLVGAIEALGLIGDKFSLQGGLWVTADPAGALFGGLGTSRSPYSSRPGSSLL
jgi:nickel/cobalt transporter (NiCoT) family protein